MEFPDFARSNGLIVRHLLADGRIHRCPTVEHPRKFNGAYQFDGSFGWVQAWDRHEHVVLFRDSKNPFRQDWPQMRKDLREGERQRRAEAVAEAQEIMKRCRLEQGHPYLVRKGFANEPALIDTNGRMVVPMRDCTRYRGVIVCVQWIAEDGSKRFLPNGVAKGSIHCLGSGDEAWFCEGYATGLSVRAGLKRLYRKDRVVVCFSAGNLEYVATSSMIQKSFGLIGSRVVADHDENGVGERAAASTGLPWAIPDAVGDANDLHIKSGVEAVAEMLRAVL